ncbi:MAG: DUF445 family protein [Gemmatimonadales bacterium]
MDPAFLKAAAVTVVGGAFAGGITNAIAIWMLFRPHERRGIGPLQLQGAIPKNKARLAKSIGRTVGEKLLTPEDLTDRLSAPAVRNAFDDAVGRAAGELLEREFGSLRAHLGPDAVAAAESAIGQVASRIADRILEFVGKEEFETLVDQWLESLRAEIGSRPVGELLTPARREALLDQVDRWVGAIAESEGLERTIRDWLANQLSRLEADPRTLGERLPPGLLGPVEQVITDSLPGALDRLGDLLADPEVKGAVRQALREAFDTAGQKLLFHERLVARFVVNDKTLARLVDGFEGEGFDRLAAAVTSEPMRDRIAQAVRSALGGFLDEPLGPRLERLGPGRRDALERTVGDWLVDAARSEAMRTSLRGALVKAFDQAGDLTWDRLLRGLSGRQAAELVRAILGKERGRAWIEQALRNAGLRLLDRPIGRPASWLGTDDTGRAVATLTQSSWGWVQGQVPMVVSRLSIPEMVEQKIIGFPLPVMEDIIRRVIERELKLIVQLGWVLGAFVGLLTFAINRAFG